MINSFPDTFYKLYTFKRTTTFDREMMSKLVKPAPKDFVEVDDEIFFFRGKSIMLKVRPQIISPPKPAALSTSV